MYETMPPFCTASLIICYSPFASPSQGEPEDSGEGEEELIGTWPLPQDGAPPTMNDLRAQVGEG